VNHTEKDFNTQTEWEKDRMSFLSKCVYDREEKNEETSHDFLLHTVKQKAVEFSYLCCVAFSIGLCVFLHNFGLKPHK